MKTAEELRAEADRLEDAELLEQGVHPTLVRLRREGWPEPDDDEGYGWSPESYTAQVRQVHDHQVDKEVTTLSIVYTYEHFDRRGGQFTVDEDFVIRGDRLVALHDEEESTPVDDFEACQRLVSEFFSNQHNG